MRRSSMSELLQPFDRGVERRLHLREAQPREALAGGRLGVERRQRDRGDALLDRQPAAELRVGQIADAGVVDELEITARDRQRPQPRAEQLVAEAVALRLVK